MCVVVNESSGGDIVVYAPFAVPYSILPLDSILDVQVIVALTSVISNVASFDIANSSSVGSISSVGWSLLLFLHPGVDITQ